MKQILFTLIILLSSITSSVAEENWSLIDDSRLITRGDIVWGHQFGFMKDLNFCGYDILLLSWSTSETGLKEFEGKNAYLKLNIDGEELDQELEFTLMFAGEMGTMEVGYFGAIVNSDSFINSLKQSSNIEFTFSNPDNLLTILDIKSDSFKTKGLAESYSLLDNSCPS